MFRLHSPCVRFKPRQFGLVSLHLNISINIKRCRTMLIIGVLRDLMKAGDSVGLLTVSSGAIPGDWSASIRLVAMLEKVNGRTRVSRRGIEHVG